jgi:hypothetical protein
MAFVADDLAAWLVGQLAERGRKRLTTFVFGTEQERALRSAATAAVEQVGRELHPDNDEQAEHVALVISQVFREPVSAAPLAEHQTVLEALQAGIAGQLAVLDDASLTGQRQSSADLLGVSGTVLAEKLTGNLLREIVVRGSRGGPLEPLAAQLNHDVTHMQSQQLHVQSQQIHDAVRQLSGEILEALARLDAARPGEKPRSLAPPDIALHVEQLFEDLGLGEHEKAERRLNRLFLHLSRDQQRAALAAIIHVATTTKDDTTQVVACSLLEAADRLDPMLIEIDEVEALARSDHFYLRSSAAVLLWQWAESIPSRMPVPLLGKLTLPSTEDWYVHAAARACAKQLLLRRAAARAIFDQMAASPDPDDRDYAVADLLEVANTEPRAVPIDLARKLARDEDTSVAARATELLRSLGDIGEDDGRNYYHGFGM